MEGRKRISILLAILLLPVCANATDITFTSSGTITDGNVFEHVYVQNDGTVIDMSGGQITNWLFTYDASIFNMSGGSISGNVYISNLSSFNVSDDTVDIGDFVVYGSASLSGGSTTAHRLRTGTTSVVNIDGGNLNFDKFEIEGVVNIYRGLLYVDDVWISTAYLPLPTINIYGYGFNYTQEILTGYLLDDNFFTIKGVDASEYARFNLLPEPMSLLLFGFGLLVLRKTK